MPMDGDRVPGGQETALFSTLRFPPNSWLLAVFTRGTATDPFILSAIPTDLCPLGMEARV